MQLSLASPALDAKQLHEAQASAASTRQVLQGARQQRQEQVQVRGAAAARLRAADAQLRTAHQARVQQRQQLLQAQAVQVRVPVMGAANLLTMPAGRSMNTDVYICVACRRRQT